jgi:alpha-ketoglutarate-dependent 2,4-dichlorophenoxyacetate dioxygenase
MSVTISPVTPDFAAEIGDVDLAKPLAADDFAAIQQAFWKYAVLIFPAQDLNLDQHLAFGQKFGPVETDRTLDPKATPSRFTGAFADISNLAADGKIWGETSRQRMYKMGNRLWHTGQFVQVLAELVLAAVRPHLSRRSAGTPNSPTSARRTMRCPTR